MKKKIPMSLRILAGLMALLVIQTVVPWSTLVSASDTPSIVKDGTTVTISGYDTVAKLITGLEEKVQAGEDYSTCTTVKISDLTTAAKSEGTTVAGLWGKYFAAMTTLDLTGTTIPGLDFDFISGSATIEKVYLPTTISYMWSRAFQSCAKLTTVSTNTADVNVVDLTGMSFGTNASLTRTFVNCSAITAVKLPATIVTLLDSAFQNCTNLVSFEAPGLVTIEGFTLGGLTQENLTVTLPSTVTTINGAAFARTSNITIAYHGIGANAIVEKLFTALQGSSTYGSGTTPKMSNIHLDFSRSDVTAETINKLGTLAADYKNFVASIDLTGIDAFQGYEPADGETSILKEYYDAGTLKTDSGSAEITVNNGTAIFTNFKTIVDINAELVANEYDFTGVTHVIFNCPELENFTNFDFATLFPGMTVLEAVKTKITVLPGFENNTTIQKLYMPTTISVVGTYDLYRGCSALTTISTNNADENVVDFSKMNIAENSQLYSTFPNCTGITKVILHKNITTLDCAFQATSLKEIVIPEGLTTLKAHSFGKLYSEELVITLPSTVTSFSSAFARSKNITIAYHGTGANTIVAALLKDLQTAYTTPDWKATNLNLDFSGSDVSKATLDAMATDMANYNDIIQTLDLTGITAFKDFVPADTDTALKALNDAGKLKFDVTQIKYSVTADPAVGGTVTGGGTYGLSDVGTTGVTFTATPGNIYLFKGWTVNGEPVDADDPVDGVYSLTLTVENKETAVVAKFEQDPEMQIELSGTITVEGEEVIATVKDAICWDDVKKAVADALTVYNTANSTELTQADVTTLVFSTPKKLTYESTQFIENPASTAADALKNVTKVDISGVNLKDGVIPAGFLRNNQVIQEVVLPEGVVEIPGWTFTGMTNLKKINIPSTVKVFGENAFQSCGLTDLALPEGMTTLGVNALQGLASLTQNSTNGILKLPTSLTIFGKDVKSNNPAANNPTDNVTRYMFFLSALKGIEYHGVGSDAFFTNMVGALRHKSSATLTQVDLSGSGVTDVHIALFPTDITYLDITDCKNIDETNADFQAYIRTIKDAGAVVLGLSGSTDVEVVVEATPAAGGVVTGATTIPAAQVPATITVTATPNQIYNFIGWTVNGEPVEAGEPVDGVYSLTIENVKSFQKIYANFEQKPQGEANLSATITVEGEEIIATVKDAVNFEEVKTAITAALDAYNAENDTELGNGDITKLVLSTPENTEYTGTFCDPGFQTFPKMAKFDLSNVVFKDSILPACTYKNNIITEVILPEGIREFPDYCFYQNSNLEKINIPSTVTKIGANVLQNCFKVTSIVLPEGLEWLGTNFGQGSSGITQVGDTPGMYTVPDSLQVWGSATASANPQANDMVNNLSRYNFWQQQITGVEYHGQGPSALYTNMIGAINISGTLIEHVDFSNSAITENEITKMTFRTNLKYLNLKGCPIDYTTGRGKMLTNMINDYIAQGTVVEYDDGIIRIDDTPTVEISVTINEGQTLADAVQAAVDAYNEGKTEPITAGNVTIMDVTTADGVMLTAEDFSYLRNNTKALRELDLSNTVCVDDIIPEKGLYQLEKMHTFSFPQGIKKIGANAFEFTDLTSIVLPEGLEEIGIDAFANCYNLGGELVIPNTVNLFFNGGIFSSAMFTSLEYHGSADLQFKDNFSGSYATLEYLDLRGNSALSEENFVADIRSLSRLKEAHLDYCSLNPLSTKGNTLFYSFDLARRSGVIVTRLNQFEEFDLSKLDEPIKGKSDSEDNYPPFDIEPDNGTTTTTTTNGTKKTTGGKTTETTPASTTTTEGTTATTTEAVVTTTTTEDVAATTTETVDATTTTEAVDATTTTEETTTTTTESDDSADDVEIPGTGVNSVVFPVAFLLLAALAGIGLTLNKRKTEGEGR